MITVQEIESGINVFRSKSANRFNGGPGNAGIMQPAIPSADKIIPTIIISVSI
jgi:hypothetical protein